MTLPRFLIIRDKEYRSLLILNISKLVAFLKNCSEFLSHFQSESNFNTFLSSVPCQLPPPENTRNIGFSDTFRENYKRTLGRNGSKNDLIFKSYGKTFILTLINIPL